RYVLPTHIDELRTTVIKHHSVEELSIPPLPVSASQYRNLLTIAHELGYAPKSLDECAWNIAIHYSSTITRRAEQTLRKHPYMSRVISIDECSNIGLEAAFKAIQRFDPDRGVPLERFIKHRVAGAIHDEARTRQEESRAVLSTAKAIYSDEIVPTSSSVTQALGVSEHIALRALHHIDKIETEAGRKMNTQEERYDVSREDMPAIPSSLRVLRNVIPPDDLYILMNHYVNGDTIRELSELTGNTKQTIQEILQKHKRTLSELFVTDTESE
ncbi:MAG: sigma factor, partial [Bdellovibrionota bacterium]